jgi:hypothetical protein
MRVSIVGRSADKAAGPQADAPQGGEVNLQVRYKFHITAFVQ